MSDVIKLFNEHKFIKSFMEKEIPEDILVDILQFSRVHFFQQNCDDVSVIVVKNYLKRKMLLNLLGQEEELINAPVILVFVVDLYKISRVYKHKKVKCEQVNLDVLLNAVINAGSVTSLTILAAENFGIFSHVFNIIGDKLNEIAELLEVPDYVFPIKATCIGYPLENAYKLPKLPINTFIHEESYKEKAIPTHLLDYNDLLDVSSNNNSQLGDIDWLTYVCKNKNFVDQEELVNFLKSKKFNV